MKKSIKITFSKTPGFSIPIKTELERLNDLIHKEIAPTLEARQQAERHGLNELEYSTGHVPGNLQSYDTHTEPARIVAQMPSLEAVNGFPGFGRARNHRRAIGHCWR